MSKINLKECRKCFNTAFNAAYNSIVEAMTEQGVKVISFINNGDSSSFDVDRSYALVESESYSIDSTIIPEEIILVMVEDNTIYVATGKDVQEVIPLFEEHDVYSPKAWEEMGIEPYIDFKSIGETYATMQTIYELALTIGEVLNHCMEDKILNDGETMTF